MGYSNGQLETLATGKGEKGDPGLPGIGYNLTDGDFDIDGKRLTEVADPIHKNDAATKEYVDNNLPAIDLSPYLKRDGTTSMTGDLNMNNHKISDLEDATNDNDAVSLKQLKKMTDHTPTNYHLRSSFTFYKDFGDKAELTKSNVSIPGHTDHFELLEISRQGVKDGFAYSDVKLTNNIDLGTYSILFEIFGYNGSNIVTDGNSDRLLFYNVEGDARISDFSHDWFSNYAKSYIIFNNSKRDVEITLQFRYYGSSNSNFKFLFLVDVSKEYKRLVLITILNFDPINMNNEKIINIGNPTDKKDAVNKEYVDNENAKQDISINDISSRKADRAEVLLRNGSQNMTGNLSMNGNRIFSLPIPTGPQQPVTKSYFESQIALIPQPDLSLYLKVPMTGDLNMNDNKITDLVTQDDVSITDYPNYVKDSKMAVNKLYVNENFLKLKGDDYDLKGKRIKILSHMVSILLIQMIKSPRHLSKQK